MFPGDTIEVEISGIGTLRNYVVAEGQGGVACSRASRGIGI